MDIRRISAKRRKGISHIYIGLVVVFISTFLLFFIFDSLEKLSAQCKTEDPPQICKQLSGFTMSMLIILLIISGFVITITTTAYIMVSS